MKKYLNSISDFAYKFATFFNLGAQKSADIFIAICTLPLCFIFINCSETFKFIIFLLILMFSSFCTYVAVKREGIDNSHNIVCNELWGMLLTSYMADSWFQPFVGFFIYRFICMILQFLKDILIVKYKTFEVLILDTAYKGFIAMMILWFIKKYLLF
ncbi:MAG: hypothetical protein UHG91_07910 [Succinivibrionaceae bacterium]|nr:hypothetical protein [Ruminobacter sp.]MDY5779168.1 hypothetical protein [Succinivibrionaceae bacterium]MEE1340680.1 hypothetical protein [Succinivibrionaceae bacterium]